MSKRRVEFALPAFYVAFALYGWVDFVNTNHDGLANVGLFLITLPVTLLGLAIGAAMGRTSFPMPSGYGYLTDHALYYVPSVCVTALLWWWIGRKIDMAFPKL